METLLISPASREEIVWGKFLTIWIFIAATALLNLASMGITTWTRRRPHSGRSAGHSRFGLVRAAWCCRCLPFSARSR